MKFAPPVLLILLLATAGFDSHAQGTWEKISIPTTRDLNSVFFTDSLYGWIAGDSGVIMHTTNGGATWEFQATQAPNNVQFLFFLDRNQGWASSFNFMTPPYGTVLLKTTDGGQHWTSQSYPDADLFINCILFRDSLNGWMGGSPHALVRTTDGGATWTQAAIAPGILANFPVISIQFYNDQYGYASGGRFDIAGVTWHTSDGGNLWYSIDPLQAPADEVHELYLFDSITVMGAGGDPDFGYGVGMTRTFDGGINWSYDELPMQGNAFDLDFRTSYEAWAPLGARQKMIVSLDTGMTWTEMPTPGQTVILRMTFPDSLHGWAVGRAGALLKYHPKVIPAVPPRYPASGGVSLEQNRPNPARDRTVFAWSLPAEAPQPASDPVIRITDLLGCKVAVVPLSDRSPGRHTTTFKTSSIPNGIYQYCLQYHGRDGIFYATPCLKMLIMN